MQYVQEQRSNIPISVVYSIWGKRLNVITVFYAKTYGRFTGIKCNFRRIQKSNKASVFIMVVLATETM